MLADAGTPVVVHASSGPVGNEHTGPAPMRALLERHPTLTAVVAHLGAPEYAEFLALAEDFDGCTSTPRWRSPTSSRRWRRSRATCCRGWRDLRDRVLLGSDFPNIPYPYAHQLEALERLGLGDDWLRAVCWDNGAGCSPAATARKLDARGCGFHLSSCMRDTSPIQEDRPPNRHRSKTGRRPMALPGGIWSTRDASDLVSDTEDPSTPEALHQAGRA